jgi:hypothetical protein
VNDPSEREPVLLTIDGLETKTERRGSVDAEPGRPRCDSRWRAMRWPRSAGTSGPENPGRMGELPIVVQGAYFSVVPPAEIRPLGPPILITSSVIVLTTNGGLDAVWAGPAGPVGPVIVEPAVSGIGRGRNRRLAVETKKYVNNFDTVDRTPLPPNIFLPCSPLFPPSPALGRNQPPLLDILGG